MLHHEEDTVVLHCFPLLLEKIWGETHVKIGETHVKIGETHVSFYVSFLLSRG